MTKEHDISDYIYNIFIQLLKIKIHKYNFLNHKCTKQCRNEQ